MKILKAIRPINLLIVAITQCVIYYLLINPIYVKLLLTPPFKLGDPQLFFLFVTITLIITASGYLINDLFDLESDKVNNKDRGVSESSLLKIYFFLVIIGFLSSLYIANQYDNLGLSAIYIVAVMGLFLYSSILKRKPLIGNVLVALFSAFVIGILFYCESEVLQSGYYGHAHEVIAIGNAFMFFTFLISLLRELIKDCEDMEGDRLVGDLSFPIKYGLAATKTLSSIIAVALIISMLLWTYVWIEVNITFALGALLAMTFILIYVLYKIRISKEKKNFTFLSNLLKLIMLFGIIYLSLISVSLWTS